MRGHHFAFGAITFALCIACDQEPSAKAGAGADARAAARADGEAKVAAGMQADMEVEGDADAEGELAAAAGVTPRIGGTIVAAGDYNVEVLAYVDGRVEAIVMDAQGELVANMPELSLVATLAAEGEAQAKVDLAWNAPQARFVGVVEGDMQLTPGELHVEVTADGDTSVGMLAELGLALQAGHGGQVMVAGGYSVEVAAEADVVHVYVADVSAAAKAKGHLDVRLQLDGDTEIAMKWDPPSASYSAELDGGVDLEARPIALRIEADGKVAMAAVASFHASANVAARGQLDARAEVHPPAARAKARGGAHGRASARGGGKVETRKSANASGKASAKTGNGSAKASVSGKAKAGFHLGGG